jgi:hypothetical protein
MSERGHFRPSPRPCQPFDVRFASKAAWARPGRCGRMPVIQTPKLKASNHGYELADDEWIAIKPMPPNKPRGVPRVNDRRVLNGIFWVLRSGAPWRD